MVQIEPFIVAAVTEVLAGIQKASALGVVCLPPAEIEFELAEAVGRVRFIVPMQGREPLIKKLLEVKR